MAPRVIKLREAGDATPEPEERISQSKRPETGRYLLQIDRQTKQSYASAETAEGAGLNIKTNYPLVQVCVYDSVEHQYKIVELPGK